MSWPGKAHSCLSKRLLDSRLSKRRHYSTSDMRFRIYSRLFPFAILNIMQHRKKFLKARDLTYDSMQNSVIIESNGMIDPYLPMTGLGSSFPEGLQHR